MGMMRHFFAGGEMGGMFPMMFPVMMVALFVAMFIARTLIFKRGGFGLSDRGYRKRRGRFSREFYEDEEDFSSYPSTAPNEVQERPTKSTQVNRLAHTQMQRHLDKARTYRTQIHDLVKSTPGQKVRAPLQDIAAQVDEWVKAIEDLAKRIDSFYQNTVIQQDLASVPQSIAELEARLANEPNESTRLELERTLANRKKQSTALAQLQATINRAEIKIESTLSALGTLYSQALTAQSTDQVADYSRLSTEVDEEVRTLQDHLEALREVKLGQV